MSLLEKALKKIKESKNVSNNIDGEEVLSKSNFVGMKNISHSPITDISEDKTIDMCPICNKRYKITQDKNMNKDEILQ